MGEFNHFDKNGNAVMVDVSGKEPTYRTAVAQGKILVSEEILQAVLEQKAKKEMYWEWPEWQESWQ